MNRKTRIILFISIVVLLVLGLITVCTLQWFFSPGVHRLLGFTHVEYLEEGYLYQEGKILKSATLEVNATGRIYSDRSEEGMDLTFRLTDLHPIDSGDEANDHGIMVHEDNNRSLSDISIHGSEVEYHPDEAGSAPEITGRHQCHIYLDENGDFLLAVYYPHTSETGYFFVQTSDPQQAQALLDEIFAK